MNSIKSIQMNSGRAILFRLLLGQYQPTQLYLRGSEIFKNGEGCDFEMEEREVLTLYELCISIFISVLVYKLYLQYFCRYWWPNGRIPKNVIQHDSQLGFVLPTLNSF